MADDIIQRSYRLSDRPARAPAAGGSDPLAELARLIGQSDPFGEYGRHQVPAAPMPAAPAFRAAEPAAEDWNGLPPPAVPPRHASPAYAEPPHYAEDERYPAPVPGYGEGAEDPDPSHFAAAQEEYYQEAPPRRRWGILVLGLVFGLAVLGAAGAFGYRALYGTPGSSPPKVIAADPTPSKLTPPKKDLSKVAAAPSAAEKLAPPPEPPVELKAKPLPPVILNQANPPSGAAPPPAAAVVASGAAPPPAPVTVANAALGSEPKKVHTVVIRPDMTVAEASPPQPRAAAPPVAPAVAPPVAPAVAPPVVPAVRPAPAAPAAPSASAPPAAPTRLAAAPSNGAPLSLSPDAPPAAPARPAPATRGTSVMPMAHVARAAAATTGGFAVQLSSRRSEAEAQAAIHGLQAKFPAQLGGHAPLIRKVELGEKGTYYRAMVGPFGSSEEAGKLCAALKAAGGSCFVQKI